MGVLCYSIGTANAKASTASEIRPRYALEEAPVTGWASAVALSVVERKTPASAEEVCNAAAMAVSSSASFCPSSALSATGVEAVEDAQAVGVTVTVVKNPC